ncbi:hypothetical protein Hanom_Chr11g00970151 [Helianthus anomalus]
MHMYMCFDEWYLYILLCLLSTGIMNKTKGENHRYLLPAGGCWKCWDDEHGPPPKTPLG